MTPLQELQAATIQPSKMLGMGAQIGSLTPGKFVDIVAVDNNPLTDFSALRGLGFVMKQGHVYRNDWEPTRADSLPTVDPDDPAFRVDGGYDAPF